MVDKFTKLGIQWSLEFSNKFVQGASGIHIFEAPVLKSFGVVIEVYH